MGVQAGRSELRFIECSYRSPKSCAQRCRAPGEVLTGHANGVPLASERRPLGVWIVALDPAAAFRSDNLEPAHAELGRRRPHSRTAMRAEPSRSRPVSSTC
jgi:hypothetical protein